VYEEKVYGWRMLAYKERNRVHLVSRTGVDHTKRFRAVAAAIRNIPLTTFVLDGEIAIFDAQFRSCFDWLRGQPDELATPPIFVAFHVLYRAGENVTTRFTDWKVTEVTLATLTVWCTNMRKRYASGSLRVYLATLKAALTVARRAGIIEHRADFPVLAPGAPRKG